MIIILQFILALRSFSLSVCMCFCVYLYLYILTSQFSFCFISTMDSINHRPIDIVEIVIAYELDSPAKKKRNKGKCFYKSHKLNVEGFLMIRTRKKILIIIAQLSSGFHEFEVKHGFNLILKK